MSLLFEKIDFVNTFCIYFVNLLDYINVITDK